MQLNLDELNALTSSLWTDKDRATALQGLSLGCNAGDCPEGVPESFRRGWAVGIAWREKADGFRATRINGGLASAAARKSKSALTQPLVEHVRSTCSTHVQHVVELNQKPETISSSGRSEQTKTPLPPKGGADALLAPKSKRVPSLTPLRSQDAQEAFARVWTAWPAKRPSDGKAAKGDKIPAERAFQKILDTGAATVAELEEAALVYLDRHVRVKEGYIVYVSTFYGDQKALWAEIVRVLRDRKASAAAQQMPEAKYL